MPSIDKMLVSVILNLIRARRDKFPGVKALVPTCSAVVPPAVLRRARFSDFDGVAALKQRWGLSHDSLENWQRLWRDNPALQRIGLERPIGWVLEADGTIVGYLGNISLLYQYGDRTLTAVASHGLVVEPNYRALSFSLVNAFYRQKSVDLYVVTSAIKSVGKIALACGSTALPQPGYDTVIFWVLRPYSFARSLMKKLKISRFPASVLHVLATFAIAADKVVRRRWPTHAAAASLVTEVTPDAIGTEFETLWMDKIRERPRLFADRCLATVRWHFEIPGDKGTVRVLCYRQKGRLDGYAVVRTDTDAHSGLQKSIIADLIARQDDPAVIRALCTAAYEHATKQGSHILEMQGFPSEVRNVCSGSHPYERTLPACPYYYKAADPVLQNLLQNAIAWYACPFDGDATLIRASYSSAPLHSPGASVQDTRADALMNA